MAAVAAAIAKPTIAVLMAVNMRKAISLQ
jgi:hypothetical protein